jgi:putative IMPACT (imprinted ancient) family translation regulator
MKDYHTVSKPVAAETEIKKSVFIAHLFAVETEDAAARFIDDLSKKHYKAAHVCYAYILGGAAELKKKFSDAGEPQGRPAVRFFPFWKGTASKISSASSCGISAASSSAPRG